MMKRIILMAGVVAIGLAVTVCVHAATATFDDTKGPVLADDTAVQKEVTDYVEYSNVDRDPAAETTAPTTPEPQPTEPQPATPQPAEPQTATPQPAVQDTAKGAITEAAAKKTALAKAGVRESDVSYIYVVHEYDDGLSIFNVDFQVGTMEYECEIDANSGAIIEFDAESIYD